MSNPKFVHLRVHSDFSMVDGLVKPESLVEHSVKLNMPSIAITDFNNLFGMIKFYKTAFKLGVKPVIGVDFNCLFCDDDFNNINNFFKITILASNNVGYKNLILLLSRAYKHGYNSKIGILIKKSWLVEYRQGLILLSGGCCGDIGLSILKNKPMLTSKYLNFYNKYFKNCYYLEVMRVNKSLEEEYIHEIKILASKKGLPLVATNEVCFLKQNDFKAHKIRVYINQGNTINDKNVNHYYTSQQFMRTAEDMSQLFIDIPEAIKNTVEIAKRCSVLLTFDKYFLPAFSKTINIDKYLVEQSTIGLRTRLKQLYPNKEDYTHHYDQYYSRLLNELNMINKMGFSGYFLIVMEFINWAKKNDIPVGPGRGSGAGSLVSYSLNITELDPLSFDLLFERFLNPERVSMPDLDIDFCMDKRDQVISHVSKIYGKNAVAQIITFGTLTAKAVIRDVGRVLGFPYGFLNKISKLIPSNPGITLHKAIEMQSELSELYSFDQDVRVLIDLSKKLEGVTRNIGKHAGGVVISPSKITNFSPLYCDEFGENPITHFDKKDIESTGLVKFDFLGLRTLTVIFNTVNMVNIKLLKRNCKLININTISLKDKNCFTFLRSANTIAVFQLESEGMQDLIKRLKPDTFEDLVALVALFRPGPLKSGMVDNFINRKHGKEVISYPDSQCQHVLLKPILQSTYGIILYQEQVMKIAQKLSNYTLGSADILRRAMEKKDPKEMKKQRVIFQKGAKINGISENLSQKIFNLLEKFAGYAFNKSHSVAYALVSYQTLWLKVHYPAEFMSSAMNSDIDNIEKLVVLIRECNNMQLTVIAPNINESDYYFKVDKHKSIIYGLGAIKGIGKSLIDIVISVRNKINRFLNLFDFCLFINSNKLTKRVLERLIMSGAFDCFGQERCFLMDVCDSVIKSVKQYLKSVSTKQMKLFDSCSSEQESIIKEFNSTNYKSDQHKILKWEKDSLGFYFSGHPVDQYAYLTAKYDYCIRLRCFNQFKNGRKVSILGMISKFKIRKTKTKKNIGFFSLEDHFKTLDVVVFNDIIQVYQESFNINSIVIVLGYLKMSNFNKKYVIVAKKFINLTNNN